MSISSFYMVNIFCLILSTFGKFLNRFHALYITGQITKYPYSEIVLLIIDTSIRFS